MAGKENRFFRFFKIKRGLPSPVSIDVPGLEGFQREYFGLLRSIALKTLTNDGELAEQAAQHAIEQLYLNQNSIRDPKVIKKWLYVTMNNYVKTQYRQARLGFNAEIDRMPWLASGITVEQEAQADMNRRMVFEALNHVGSSDQKIALELHYFNGMQYHEIAEFMGTTIFSVRNWINRGKQQMKKYLQSNYKMHNFSDFL